MNDRAARQADITRQLRQAAAGEEPTGDQTVLLSWLEEKYATRPDTGFFLACEHLSVPLREGAWWFVRWPDRLVCEACGKKIAARDVLSS